MYPSQDIGILEQWKIREALIQKNIRLRISKTFQGVQSLFIPYILHLGNIGIKIGIYQFTLFMSSAHLSCELFPLSCRAKSRHLYSVILSVAKNL